MEIIKNKSFHPSHQGYLMNAHHLFYQQCLLMKKENIINQNNRNIHM